MNGVPPLRWAVLITNLEPVIGHEQGGERRALVVSYEAFHRSGRVTICPITAARGEPRYTGDVPIPIGEAGQTKPGVILCHQVRTVSLLRVKAMLDPTRSPVGYVLNPSIRRAVRSALAHHLGLDLSPHRDRAAGGEMYRTPMRS